MLQLTYTFRNACSARALAFRSPLQALSDASNRASSSLIRASISLISDYCSREFHVCLHSMLQQLLSFSLPLPFSFSNSAFLHVHPSPCHRAPFKALPLLLLRLSILALVIFVHSIITYNIVITPGRYYIYDVNS